MIEVRGVAVRPSVAVSDTPNEYTEIKHWRDPRMIFYEAFGGTCEFIYVHKWLS